jgi:3-hydroxybutyryl-CoA dehydrogenase
MARPISRVAVVGAGLMGHAIALTCAKAGLRVRLTDVDRRVLAEAGRKIERVLATLVKNRVLGGRAAAAASRRVEFAGSLAEAVADADLVQESVQEDVAVKKRLFAELDRACARDTILATNTSSIRIGELAAATRRPGRVVGAHWFSPAYLMPVMEVVVGRATSKRTARRAVDYARRLAKVPVLVKDTPGFVVNRIQMAMLNEAIALVDRGIATAADVDAAVRIALGSRLSIFGPLCCNDIFVTKRTSLNLFVYLHGATGEDKFRPSGLLRRLVKNDDDGAFSGSGFFRYPGSTSETLARRDKALVLLMRQLAQFERRNPFSGCFQPRRLTR